MDYFDKFHIKRHKIEIDLNVMVSKTFDRCVDLYSMDIQV